MNEARFIHPVTGRDRVHAMHAMQNVRVKPFLGHLYFIICKDYCIILYRLGSQQKKKRNGKPQLPDQQVSTTCTSCNCGAHGKQTRISLLQEQSEHFHLEVVNISKKKDAGHFPPQLQWQRTKNMIKYVLFKSLSSPNLCSTINVCVCALAFRQTQTKCDKTLEFELSCQSNLNTFK